MWLASWEGTHVYEKNLSFTSRTNATMNLRNENDMISGSHERW